MGDAAFENGETVGGDVCACAWLVVRRGVGFIAHDGRLQKSAPRQTRPWPQLIDATRRPPITWARSHLIVLLPPFVLSRSIVLPPSSDAPPPSWPWRMAVRVHRSSLGTQIDRPLHCEAGVGAPSEPYSPLGFCAMAD